VNNTIPAAQSTADGGRPLLLVTVGSDHHPFDRLISWVDSWLDANGNAERLRVVSQYGTAAAPRHGQSTPFLEHRKLLQMMREAAIIVAQGGPYSLLESVQSGCVPIAVPRNQAQGEVVDDHQHAFCALLAERGQAVLATTQAELHEALDRAMADPASFVAAPEAISSGRAEAVRTFGRLVAPLRSRGRRRFLARRPPEMRRPLLP
jgi:UDP-N-acetylglucosamine transferase subunit ALG13